MVCGCWMRGIVVTMDSAEVRGAGTPDSYTLSLHDALPISLRIYGQCSYGVGAGTERSNAAAEAPAAVGITRIIERGGHIRTDRKSTRLNSSHANNAYAVLCYKKTIFLVCRPARGPQRAILR